MHSIQLKVIYLLFLFTIVSKLVFGQLDFMDRIYNAQDGINGIRATEGLLMSSDARHVYIGSQRGISLFKNDASNNSLEFVKTYYHQTDHMYHLHDIICMVISHDNRFLYAVSSDGYIIVFRRDIENGELSILKSYGKDFGDSFRIHGLISLEFSDDGKLIDMLNLIKCIL